jgi:hypothetical protein
METRRRREVSIDGIFTFGIWSRSSSQNSSGAFVSSQNWIASETRKMNRSSAEPQLVRVVHGVSILTEKTMRWPALAGF